MLAFFNPGTVRAGFRVFNTLINRWRATIVVLLALSGNYCAAQMAKDSTVFVIDIQKEIMPGLARQFSHAMQQANEQDADLILLHINTYGGLLDAADSIRTAILNSPIPVVAYIDNNAASAGALISIACNRIYMRSGSSIGAATVVDGSAQQLPDKYQSYMRSMMRATAEKRGRNPLIAEAMVDERTAIPGVIDSGKVLTFTATEAIANGYCEGMAESVEEVLQFESAAGWGRHHYEPTFIDNLISMLTHPAVSGILLMILIGGIYFELQTPGIGFPLLAATVAAILYFAPLYVEGLASNWEILLVIIGFGLLAAEIFLIPGFGVAGVSGIVFLVVGLTFSMISNDGLDFSHVPFHNLLTASGIVVFSMAATLILFFATGSKLLQSGRLNRMVLQTAMTSKSGYHSSDLSAPSLVGANGIVLSQMRPTGKVQIGDISYTATSEEGFTAKGTKIVVTRFDGLTLWVKEQTS